MAQFLERFVDLAHELGLPQRSSTANSAENTPRLAAVEPTSLAPPPPGELLLGEAALEAQTQTEGGAPAGGRTGEAGWKSNAQEGLR